jgi:DNA-directed RNA polymerase specialized sigma24 family protein
MARLQRLWRFALARNAVRSTGGAELAQLLAIAAGLPDDTRRVVTLHKVYGLATPEIAARLHLARAAVEQHLVTAALAYYRERRTRVPADASDQAAP